MKRKIRALVLITLSGLMISPLPVSATQDSEKVMYLGVVNGQMVGNSVVKVNRTLSEPELYLSGGAELPDYLTIRNADVRPASGGMAYITVKQILPDNREARITLKSVLMVDGKKVAISARQQGENVVIIVPYATRLVELRTNAPVELEIPKNYRGNVQLAMQVEGNVLG